MRAAKRHYTASLYKYRMAGLPSLSGATHSYYPLLSQLSLGGSHAAIKRHISTNVVLVQVQVQA